MHRALLSAVLFLSVLLCSLVAAQDASYTFTSIDVPGTTHTEVQGINTAGQIVGRFGDATGTHGFLTSNGTTFTTINVPGAIYTVAHGINDRGEIVGAFADATGTHGFLAISER
jgi:probable HAF family extracellular repeat protein